MMVLPGCRLRLVEVNYVDGVGTSKGEAKVVEAKWILCTGDGKNDF